MAYLPFLITTTGASGNVTLDDLGGRTFPNSLTNFDIGQEFEIDEIRYSRSLASAIYNDGWTVTNSYGYIHTAKASLELTVLDLNAAQHAQTSDDLPEGVTNLYVSATNITNVLGTLSLDDLGDVSIATTALTSGDILTWTGSIWENVPSTATLIDTDGLSEGSTNLYFTNTRARNAISIDAGSTSFLGYDSVTGKISVKALAITDVTVDATYASIAEFVAVEYSLTGGEFQEGDIVILTAATGGTKTYIHNGGTNGDDTDFTLIEAPNLTDAYIRGLFSGTAPISYSSGTGAFSLSLKTQGGLEVQSNELALNLGHTSITGVLDETNGGTGLSSYTVGDLLYASGTTTLSKLADIATGNVLLSGGIGVAPSYGKVGLTTHVSGVLPAANGGTGVDTSSASNGQLLIGNGSGLTLATLTEGDDIDIVNAAGSITISIEDASIDAGKLADGTAPTAGQVLTATSSSATSGFTWVDSSTLGSKKTWTWGAASTASNNTDRFLDRHDGVATNNGPYIAWFACKLRAISLGTSVAGTWTAHVYVNGSSVATLASGGSQTAYISGLNISIAAGDKVSFYLAGTSINTPSIDALFEEA